MSIAASLAYGLVNVVHRRMLWLMLWPVFAAGTIWAVLAFLYWGPFVQWLAATLGRWLAGASAFVGWDPSQVALIAAKIAALLAIVPLVQLTALLILGIFGIRAIVEHVAGRAYPELERRRGGSFVGSAWNGVVALLGLGALALVSVPLWFFPPLWPVIPVAILGWVNQRVLRYDALAEHADAVEMKAIFRSRRLGLYVLGMLLALVAYVPVIGFFAPVLFGLSFVHYLLGALRLGRSYPDDGNRKLAGTKPAG
jgi:CysZ protein